LNIIIIESLSDIAWEVFPCAEFTSMKSTEIKSIDLNAIIGVNFKLGYAYVEFHFVINLCNKCMGCESNKCHPRVKDCHQLSQDCKKFPIKNWLKKNFAEIWRTWTLSFERRVAKPGRV
jgi:hypothetical protein